MRPYGLFPMWELDVNFATTKSHTHSPNPGILRTTDEQEKLGNLKVEQTQVRVDTDESRGVDLGHEVLQVPCQEVAVTNEFKIGESGKDSPHWGIQTPSALINSRTREQNTKALEPGQYGQTRNYRPW